MSKIEEVLQGLAEWSHKFKEVSDNPPAIGSILKSINGEAILTVEIHDDKPPFIYGKAFVPEITDLEPAWYLQDEDHHSYHGLKCILMARARADLIKQKGLTGNTVKIKSLRVIKYSQSGQSLLCEVENYG